jgi:cytochrome c biogenesis protein CcdA
MLNIELPLLLATGLVLGLLHSLDADHVVAVSTLLCNTTSLRKSIASATAWGTGHSVTLLLSGLLVLVLRVAIPENIANYLELPGGIVLILLGVFLIKSVITHKTNVPHEHQHTHLDSNGKSIVHTHAHVHKSMAAGVLQGLGGSAAIMLVTLTTVPSAELGLIYILIFGLGVILGMVSVACLISSLLSLTTSRLQNVHEKIKAITGTISIGFGIFIILQVML